MQGGIFHQKLALRVLLRFIASYKISQLDPCLCIPFTYQKRIDAHGVQAGIEQQHLPLLQFYNPHRYPCLIQLFCLPFRILRAEKHHDFIIKGFRVTDHIWFLGAP